MNVGDRVTVRHGGATFNGQHGVITRYVTMGTRIDGKEEIRAFVQLDCEAKGKEKYVPSDSLVLESVVDSLARLIEDE